MMFVTLDCESGNRIVSIKPEDAVQVFFRSFQAITLNHRTHEENEDINACNPSGDLDGCQELLRVLRFWKDPGMKDQDTGTNGLRNGADVFSPEELIVSGQETGNRIDRDDQEKQRCTDQSLSKRDRIGTSIE